MAFDPTGRINNIENLIRQTQQQKAADEQVTQASNAGLQKTVGGGLGLLGMILSFIPGMQPVGAALSIGGAVVGGGGPNKQDVGNLFNGGWVKPQPWNAPFTTSQGPLSTGG